MNSKPEKRKNGFSGVNTLSQRKNGSRSATAAAIPVKTPQKQKIVPPENETSEISLAATLEKVQLAAVMLNLYGEILYCNDHLLTLAGRKAKEVMEKNWFDVFVPVPRQEDLRLFYAQNILSETFPSQSNYEIQGAFGTSHFISWTHSFLHDGKGRTTGLFSIGTEIDMEEISPEEKESPEKTTFSPQAEIRESLPQENPKEEPSPQALSAEPKEEPVAEVKAPEGEKPAETLAKVAADRAGKYLTFLLNDEEFGVGIGEVKEIMGLVPIRPLPKSPPYIKGVINLRGRMVPIIDLRSRFGLRKTDATPKTCIAILEIGGPSGSLRIGAIVDTVLEVLRIKEEEIENAPSLGAAVNTEFILGLAKSSGKVKILLNMREVLGSEFFPSPGKPNGSLYPVDAPNGR